MGEEELKKMGFDERTNKNLNNLRLTDDSNPDQGKFSLYLTPTRVNKQRESEVIIDNLCKSSGIVKENLEVLYAGDSFPDLAMGLLSGIGTKATFLLVGGSRLNPSLIIDGIADFAGQGINAIKKRLKMKRNGEYLFKPPLQKERTLILADQYFPGTKSAESILLYLRNLSWHEKISRVLSIINTMI